MLDGSRRDGELPIGGSDGDVTLLGAVDLAHAHVRDVLYVDDVTLAISD